jgi:hypothetical protein
MIDGPTPNHHFTSSTEGVGKGLCASMCAFPFVGRDLDINPQKESEAEWRKALTTFLLTGGSHYFIDNIRNPTGWDNTTLDIESGVLCAAWTGGRWKDRILGGNEQANPKLHAVWMSSGNNVTFSRELTRRIVPIEIKATCENPSQRTNFKHKVQDWVKENRVALTRCCLILCQNWIARGRQPGSAIYGSYEAYARTMGGILEACGVEGFLGNLPKSGSGKDRESTRWPALVDEWHKDRASMPTSTGQLYDLIFGVRVKKEDRWERSGGVQELQIAFADVVGDGKEISRKQKLGHAVLKQDGRVWSGYRIVRCEALGPNGSPLYRLDEPEVKPAVISDHIADNVADNVADDPGPIWDEHPY